MDQKDSKIIRSEALDRVFARLSALSPEEFQARLLTASESEVAAALMAAHTTDANLSEGEEFKFSLPSCAQSYSISIPTASYSIIQTFLSSQPLTEHKTEFIFLGSTEQPVMTSTDTNELKDYVRAA